LRVLVTGSNGFVGKNLVAHLSLRPGLVVLQGTRATPPREFEQAAREADLVFHLAGVNRPDDPRDFAGNVASTETLCRALAAASNRAPIVFTSSVQAERANDYGASKRRAEEVLLEHGRATGAPLAIYRLPNVFGKWCRPDYNSVVATFCYNISRDASIRIDDAAKQLSLVYVDDVVAEFLRCLDGALPAGAFGTVEPVYTATVGEIAEQIHEFRRCRETLTLGAVGAGLERALYATYISYLPTERFVYDLHRHEDPRGAFVEFLKSTAGGQLSYFTAHPGVTRGRHYHHSKTEKFLVVRGEALFKFRNLITQERHEVRTSGERPQVVETVPGWAHDITNVGPTEMTVMLWANELFDHQKPDTYESTV
jgi:UDP-2-acetamido-2,6-beta-L-arabino-hexul-4-ose reductase